MFAFADLEARIDSGAIDVGELLKKVENNWVTAEEKNILMEEIRNNGEWVRIWRRALIEYLQ
ncbi:hypothetical protein D3C77_764910 [compost metagenome]